MIAIIKRKLFEISIRFLERELNKTPVESLSEEQYNGLLSMLWDNSAFRNYVKERDQKLVYSIAGQAGSEPEPRDKTRMFLGQRVENLLLASKAKTAAARRDKQIALKKEANEKKEN